MDVYSAVRPFWFIAIGFLCNTLVADDNAAVKVAAAQATANANPGQPPTAPPNGQPDQKKEGENGADKKADSPEPKVIRRDSLGDETANNDELKATVGEDGRVAFQFRNQPWVELVQWLSDICDQPMDWQELPGDRVNLASPGRYTVSETRDLFNRHLLSRGYTILELDGGLTVAKTANINPAMVPRVDVDELADLATHTFVRTSLDVGWLSAEKLAEELKPMISSNGKLTALTTTNRLEAMDAAVNVRQIAELLDQERNSSSREALAPEFKLRHLPAEEAKRMLEEFLGVKKKEPAPMTPQQMQMRQQQMQQQGGQPKPEPKKIEVSIVANTRQNSIIIRAPPDRVAIATEFLTRIDVPSTTMVSLAALESRVSVHRLASLDPEKLIEIVGEMNILEPTTRIRVDKENSAIIVSGSGADRYIIESLIKRLDGSGRAFHVLQLRRLEAKEVAESITFLLGKQKDDDKNSRRRYYWWDDNKEDDKKKDEFRVAANSRFRQVLLWANDIEMEQVQSLLVKLGELPPEGGSNRTIRTIDAAATPETYEYLQRLRQQWSQLSPNPLEIPDAERFTDPNELPDNGVDEETDEDKADGEAEPTLDRVDEETVAMTEQPPAYRLTVMQGPVSDGEIESESQQDEQSPAIRSAAEFDRAFGERTEKPTESKSSDKPLAPVRIELDESGNLILISPDTKALDQLENLMLHVAPPKRPYKVFAIKHASSYWMKLNLEDYFESDDGKKQDNSLFRWYWDMEPEEEEQPAGLGADAKLKFVDDVDTNTLVVTGATSEQLRTIAELIELWDVPEPVNKRRARYMKLVQIQYGKASKIAETLKEAYRDLLSSNDKTFAGGKGQAGQEGGGNKAEKSRDGNGSGLVDSKNGNEGGGTDFSFKGKLSFGVDEIGNTLLVSAEGESLLELVVDVVKQLDTAAQPGGEVEVIQFSGDLSSQALEKALQAFGAVPSRSDNKPRNEADQREERNPERRGRRRQGGSEGNGYDRGKTD